eukprot:SAG31_NODE_1548_length_7914_cov_5.353423_1_plen_54_part_10
MHRCFGHRLLRRGHGELADRKALAGQAGLPGDGAAQPRAPLLEQLLDAFQGGSS